MTKSRSPNSSTRSACVSGRAPRPARPLLRRSCRSRRSVSGQSNPTRAARFCSFCARRSAGRPTATPSSVPFCALLSPLRRLDRLPVAGLLLGRFVAAFARRRHADGASTILSAIVSRHVLKVEEPASPRRLPCDRRSAAADRPIRPRVRPRPRARSRRPPRRLPRSYRARCVAKSCSMSQGQPVSGSRSRRMISRRRRRPGSDA